jgi:hypothetical protein
MFAVCAWMQIAVLKIGLLTHILVQFAIFSTHRNFHRIPIIIPVPQKV